MIAALLDHNVIQEMGVSSWNLGFGGQSQRSTGYGAFAGYNWQWDDAVLGVEASYMHASFGVWRAHSRSWSAARRCLTAFSMTLR
jgi:outer membrane immunogenic protein